MKRLRADRSRRRDEKEEDQKSDNESYFSFSSRLHLNSAVQLNLKCWNERECASAEGAKYESQGQAPAPKARNIIARGKREAQRNASPLDPKSNLKRALKVRNINLNYFALSELDANWRWYQGRRASRCSALAPGYYISRLRR